MKHAHTYDLSVDDVAAHYALSPRTIRDRLKSGDLDGVRIDGRWRLCWHDVFAAEDGPAPSKAHIASYKRPLLCKTALGSQWKLSKRTVERWLQAGLPTRNVFGSVRIAPHDADIWMRKRFDIPSARNKAQRGKRLEHEESTQAGSAIA
jgi:hypothetical protein